MLFVDTHCHIHEVDYPLDREEVLARARQYGVDKMICVGTSIASSRDAVAFVKNRDNLWASIGIHPHEAKDNPTIAQLRSLLTSSSGIRSAAKVRSDLASLCRKDKMPEEEVSKLRPRHSKKIVAIGECGLDYFYHHSPKEAQIPLLRQHIELSLEADLPLIFHVRDAFDDFWPIFDSYKGIRGVLHSFTDSIENLNKALERGLYIGVNGISTFTKDEAQKAMFAQIPLERMLHETDAPFLTPVPKRGSINEPAFVTFVAQFIADLQHTSLTELSGATAQNATQLFQLK